MMRKYVIDQRDEQKFIMNFVPGEYAFKFYFTEIKFYSFPRNSRGSLVTDFRTITLQKAIEMDSDVLHEYWPYLVPFNEDIVYDDGKLDYSVNIEQVTIDEYYRRDDNEWTTGMFDK